MCLETLQTKPITASKDITCYKVLMQSPDGKLVSPYRLYEYTIGKEESADIGYTASRYSGCGRIEEGLHTIASLPAAKAKQEELEYDRLNYGPINGVGNILLVECIIPKDAEYYSGVWGFNSIASFASNKLKVIRILGKEDVSQN